MTRAEVIAIREALRGIGIDDVGDIEELGPGGIHVQIRGDAATHGQVVSALATAVPRAVAYTRIPARGGGGRGGAAAMASRNS